MKKVFAVLILATLVAGGVFAQVGNADNWVGGQLSLFGAGVKYERVLTPNWTVGGAAYWTSLILWNNVGVKAFGRYFPWGNIFFAELGLGFGYRTGFDDFEYTDYSGAKQTGGDEWYSMSGFLIEPGVGWKIDVGAPGGFYIEPVVTIPLVLGKKTPIFSGWNGENKFGVGPGFVAAFGMGYAF